MEGNFLSRYNNKVAHWKQLIDEDPSKKSKYETEMAEYLMKCMPYMNQYTEENEEVFNTDNVFNVKETVGLKRKDIFRDYLKHKLLVLRLPKTSLYPKCKEQEKALAKYCLD